MNSLDFSVPESGRPNDGRVCLFSEGLYPGELVGESPEVRIDLLGHKCFSISFRCLDNWAYQE